MTHIIINFQLFLIFYLFIYAVPQRILPGPSDSCASADPTNRWQDFLDLILPTIQVRTLYRLLQITASKTHLARASSSIRTIWPSRRSRCILIHYTTSMLLRSSYSSLLDRMWKSSLTRSELNISSRTFLSNTLKAIASVLHWVWFSNLNNNDKGLIDSL